LTVDLFVLTQHEDIPSHRSLLFARCNSMSSGSLPSRCVCISLRSKAFFQSSLPAPFALELPRVALRTFIPRGGHGHCDLDQLVAPPSLFLAFFEEKVAAHPIPFPSHWLDSGPEALHRLERRAPTLFYLRSPIAAANKSHYLPLVSPQHGHPNRALSDLAPLRGFFLTSNPLRSRT